MTTWSDVIAFLRTKGYHTKLWIPRPFQDPLSAGMYRSIGTPVGQSTDYRLRLDDGKGLHVREFPQYYQAHLDDVDPSQSLVGHMFADMPGVSIPLAMIFLRRV